MNASAAESRFWLQFLRFLCACLAASIITLPFMDALWLGEVPLLALIQVPKASAAHWVQDELVSVIRALGYSRGSASPDSILTRPYALALTYLPVILTLAALLFWRTRFSPPFLKWTLIFLALATVDFVMMLWLAGGPGFSIY